MSEQQRQRRAVVPFEGELDLEQEAAMLASIDEHLAEGPDAIHIDLSAVTFIDSSGLRALCLGRERAAAAGVAFGVIDPRPNVLKVLEITGLDEVFSVEGR